MQLAIYEPEHFETAYALIRLFDLPANSITIFTNAPTAVRLHEMFGAHASSYKWHIQNEGETNRRFITRMYASLRTLNPDMFIFGTISHNYLLHALLLRSSRVKRILLTVHEVNSFFRPRLRWGVRMTGNYIGKKIIIRRVNEYISILPTLLPAIKDCLPPYKKIHSLSGAVFEGNQVNVPLHQRIRIVVPGSVEQSRRDYQQVINLFDAAAASGLPLEITLLGSSKEKIIHPHILTYGDVVPQVEFDVRMHQAHFIFAPIVSHTISPDGVPETYGTTKASGTIFDIIRYAKPAFVPHHLTVSADIEGACIRYHTVQEIVTFIQNVLQNPSHYENLQRHALECSLHYTVEKIRGGNPELFN
jgi:hypothetical protein